MKTHETFSRGLLAGSYCSLRKPGYARVIVRTLLSATLISRILARLGHQGLFTYPPRAAASSRPPTQVTCIRCMTKPAAACGVLKPLSFIGRTATSQRICSARLYAGVPRLQQPPPAIAPLRQIFPRSAVCDVGLLDTPIPPCVALSERGHCRGAMLDIERRVLLSFRQRQFHIEFVRRAVYLTRRWVASECARWLLRTGERGADPGVRSRGGDTSPPVVELASA